MNLKQLPLLLLLLLTACKTIKPITGGEVDPEMSTARIIKNHYARQSDFKTLSGTLKIDYTRGKEHQSVPVSLRMQKDNIIWLTAPFGVVKAYISPEKVAFYNKLNATYFEGDYHYLSNLLGTQLNFDKVQNLILGNAIVNLRKEAYTASVVQNRYQLKPEKAEALFKTIFQLEPQHFRIASQTIAQPQNHKQWQARYTYQEVSEKVLPDELQIVATEKDDITAIAVRFQNLELNQALSFPYKVPKGFKSITVK